MLIQTKALRFRLLWIGRSPAKEGLNARGLIIILPVNSRYCILYYDPIIYSVRRPLRLSRSEVDVINRLQYVNSWKKVFFSPEFNSEYFARHLLSLSTKLQEMRRSYNEKKVRGKLCKSGDFRSLARVEKFASFREIPNFLKYTYSGCGIDLSLGKNWFR